MRFPTAPLAAVPHLDVNCDMGPFVYAVAQMPPRNSYIAEGTSCSWTEYMRLWSQVTGKTGRFQEVSLEYIVSRTPDSDFGKELAYMFQYSTDPGYDGGDTSLLKAADIIKVSFARQNLAYTSTED
jgi:hypothetical protein